MKHIIAAVLLILSLQLSAQIGQTQTVKGTITDKASETPLVGAIVLLAGSNPPLATASDEKGHFELAGVPTGRQTFIISYLGYNNATIPEVLVEAGKQVIIDVPLEEKVSNIKEVVVSDTKKGKPVNEYSSVSAQSFSVEEVTRYSGGRNDIGHLVSNYAGVSSANDSRNDIIVRGNSPTGLLWMLEGVPIPNPNQFSTLGTTGGPVSALNPNLLKNSDFLTGAFPAQYGNANASVFDIGYRNGNAEKYEFLVQLNMFSGFEAMAEGPLTKNNGGSFIFSYRYSFAGIGASLGIPIGTKATPQYQDLNFKIDLPNSKKFGHFSLFGFGAYSYIDFLAKDYGPSDEYAGPGVDAYVKGGTAVLGLKHFINVNSKSYIKTVISGSTAISTFDQYDYTYNPTDTNRNYATKDRDYTHAVRINSFFNEKYNSQLMFRAGVTAEVNFLSTYLRTRDGYPDWIQVRNYNGTLALIQPYGQVQYKFNEKLTFNGGIHTQVLSLNGSWSIEPRASLSYSFLKGQTISLAYGLHSQMQPLPVYFYKGQNADGTYDNSNQKLGFTRSNHIVLSYDLKFKQDWHVKVEPYVQFIFNAPVTQMASSFSELNSGADFVFPDQGFLTNKGLGRNMGVELTLEKFFSKGYYGLVTASLFDSRFRGSDNVWRNTAFNSHYVANALIGKEFKIGKKKRNAFTIDTKFSTTGGKWYTPINVAGSQAAGKAVLDSTHAFGQQYPYYLRWDVKFGMRFNGKKKKISQSFYVDFQNVTFRNNIFTQNYNKVTGQIYNVYQVGFFPDVMYRIQF